MANEIKYRLNAHLADNKVTPDNPDDKILEVIYNGTADKERIIAEMMAVNPGLEVENLRHVLDLENRVIQKLLMTGYRVNNGLFTAEARCRGVIEGGAWDGTRNSVYVNLTQGKNLREAIAATGVAIVGKKSDVMFVSGGTDTATRAPGFTATPGRAFEMRGSMIKIAGDDPAVGISLTDADGEETAITADRIVVNNPSNVIFILPEGLADGEYTVTMTTQYSRGSLLKSPRSVAQRIVIGRAPETGDGGDDHPLG